MLVGTCGEKLQRGLNFGIGWGNFMECLKPKYLHEREMVVPCGNCAFCAATRRSDWALRLHYEAKKHYGSKFITLTYSNNNLIWAHGNPQLSKPRKEGDSHLQLFFKRVRKAGYKFRYYAVGEYGSRTFRPHYHVLMFGDVPDEVIRQAWANYNRSTKKHYPLGHVHIGKVTIASVMYCLGYLVNGKGWQMHHHRVKPFCIMSRRPGLGHSYLTKEMIAWHKSDRKNYAVLDGQRRHLPRYYKLKIFSKIDLVRIAVRDQKEMFKAQVKWLRDPRRRRMKNPLKELEKQRKALAASIRFKSKEYLTI